MLEVPQNLKTSKNKSRASRVCERGGSAGQRVDLLKEHHTPASP